MIGNILLSPPVLFLLLLAIGLALSHAVSGLAAPGGANGDRKLESYACGQRHYTHNTSPDYGQFFPYAFFFTIMHVLVLVIATAPRDVLTMPLLYVGAGLLALYIIFRR
ncbi:MAG: hypothetical protein K6B40_02290 [Firmicutes bacterium]|nr:hypothetical protein [Bacillota bacterium]